MRLPAIEKSSASAAQPKAKKSVCIRNTAGSSLPESSVGEDLLENDPICTHLDMIGLFKSRLRTDLDSCLTLTKRYGSEIPISGGSVDIYVKETVKWSHEYI